MKRILAGMLVLAATTGGAAERRELDSISLMELVRETQQTRDQDGSLALVWWIPLEFWELSARGGPGGPELGKELRRAFEDYLVVGVVEGEHRAISGLEFLSRESVASRLRVYVGESEFQAVERPRKEAQILVESIKPVLRAMLGDLGAHFHIMMLSNRKRAPLSAYEPGTVRVSLTGLEGKATKTFEFEAPLDAMHVPRLCPNGRPAHVSWKYCPWDGTRLAD